MKALIIEDRSQMLEAVSEALRLGWPEVNLVSASDRKEAVGLVRSHHPDMVVLGIDLADLYGFEVLRRIRCYSDVPLVVLAGAADNMYEVAGLEMGADDYISEPFSHLELLARFKAVVRRVGARDGDGSGAILVAGDLVIDCETREVTSGGRRVDLTNIEYELLCQLVKGRGKVLTHSYLLTSVWGPECSEFNGYLKKYIHGLRKKLGNGSAKLNRIVTVWGKGYKFS